MGISNYLYGRMEKGLQSLISKDENNKETDYSP